MDLRTRIRYTRDLALTRLMWSWRMHAIGTRTSLAPGGDVNNPRAVSIGSHVSVARRWTFTDLEPSTGTQPKIRIGDWCTILHEFQINARVGVTIGQYVLIAARVLITDSDHVIDPDGISRTSRSREFRSSPVVIEHDCWLGQNAVILKGVRIGHHSIIAANAVVTKDVPPLSIVGGVPGRVIGSTRNARSQPGAGAAVAHSAPSAS